jgi:hypothetical protein
MTKLLFTLTRKRSEASLDSVKRDLDLDDEEIDSQYGLVAIEPEKDRYAILVEASASSRLAALPGVEGPFANPRIEPFGPPQR